MPENLVLECPFCHKKTINVVHFPPVLQTSTSHAAGKTKTKYYYTKDRYEVHSGCSNCGKSAKEVEKALNEGKKDPEKDKKIMERLRQQGLFSGEITTKF